MEKDMLNLSSNRLSVKEGGSTGIQKTSGEEHAFYLTGGQALLVIKNPDADWKYPIDPLTSVWIPDHATYELINSGAGNIEGVFFKYRVK